MTRLNCFTLPQLSAQKSNTFSVCTGNYRWLRIADGAEASGSVQLFQCTSDNKAVS